MTTISESNFKSLLSTNLDLKWNLLTDSLDSIHKFDLYSRYTHADEFGGVKLCENIKYTFEKFAKENKTLNYNEKITAVSNLEAMQAKFSRSEDPYKASECKRIIDEILGNIKDKNGDSKKTYFTPKEYHYVTPTRNPEPISYTKAAPKSWGKPTAPTTSNPTPAKTEPYANHQQKYPKQSVESRHKRDVESNDSRETHTKPRHKRGVGSNATSVLATEAQRRRKKLKHVPKGT